MWGKYLDILNCFNHEANKNVPKNKTQDKNNTSGTYLHQSPASVPPNLHLVGVNQKCGLKNVILGKLNQDILIKITLGILPSPNDPNLSPHKMTNYA